jgi:hypothetical protein
VNIIIGNGEKVYGVRKKSDFGTKGSQGKSFLKNENGLAKKFLSKYWLTLTENIILDICVSPEDARIRRTCVVSTKNTLLESKNAILAAKMLKIRKKSQTMAFSWQLSSKNSEKHLTFHKK